MPKLQENDEPNLKSNVLPFPALKAAPPDPPQPTVWHVLGVFFVLVAGLGLLALTLWALLM